jgi:prephenate dehydrogenase
LSVALPEKYYEVVASGFRDTTRIAASDPDLWTAIFLENSEPLLEALDKYEASLNQFRIALKAGDKKTLRRLWTTAKSNRDAMSTE